MFKRSLIIIFWTLLLSSSLQVTAQTDDCSLPTRLAIGSRGRVLPPTTNNLRESPSVESRQLVELPVNGIFDVLDGPVCDNGIRWWQVQLGAFTGWTAEGQDSVYWLAPVTSERFSITAGNAARVQPVGILGRGLINALAWTADDTQLVVDSSIGRWLYDANNLYAAPQPLVNDATPPFHVETSMETVTIIESRTGVSRITTRGYYAEFNHDFSLVGIWDGDHTLSLWNTTTGEVIYSLEGYYSVEFSADNSLMAYSRGISTEDDLFFETHILNLSTQEDFILLSSDSPPSEMAFNANNTLIAVQHWGWMNSKPDDAVEVWNLITGTRTASLIQMPRYPWTFAFNTTGTILAGGNADGEIRFWDTTSWQEIAFLPGSTPGRELSFSSDGQYLAEDELYRATRLWNTQTWDEPQSPYVFGSLRDDPPQGRASYPIAFSPQGNFFAIGNMGQIEFWQLPIESTNPLSVIESQGEIIRFSRDGHTLAIAQSLRGGGAQLILWDTTGNGLLPTLLPLQSYYLNFAFSPDSSLIAIGDDPVRVYSADTGEELTNLEGGDFINEVAFSPDGWLLAVGSAVGSFRGGGGKVTFYNVETWEEVLVIQNPTDTYLIGTYVNDITFSPDSSILAIATDSGSLTLWSTSSGELLNVLEGHSESVWSVAFSPDGSLLASSSGGVNEGAFETFSSDSVVRLWAIDS